MTHALLERPLFVFLVSLFLAYVALRVVASAKPSSLRLVGVTCGAVSVSVFVALNILNLSRPGFLWHDEASILSVAAAYLHGEPMYHARTDPALYSLLYGPSTFLAYVPLLKFSTHPMTSVRWFALAVNLANLLLLYMILRRRSSGSMALSLLPIAIAVLLPSASSIFGVRGDALLLLCFCISLVAALYSRPLGAAVVSGVVAGLAVDFKLTVFPAVCLLFFLVYRWSGRRAALLCMTATAVTAASLFFLPHISFDNYMAWLALSSRHGLMPNLLRNNMLAALFMLAPGLVIRFSRTGRPRIDPSQKAGLLLFALALAASILTGSKNGAGQWHLWPMLPFVMMWAGEEARQVRSHPIERATSRLLLASVAIATTLVVLRLSYRDLQSVHPQDGATQRAAQQAAEAELHDLVRQNPNQNVAMGYGWDASDYRSSLRFELPSAGEDYFLDENALVELTKTGSYLPDGLTERILGCNDLWLAPHGEEPFQTRRAGVLPAAETDYLFPDAIRLSFAATHTRQSSGSYYDVWACPHWR